MTIEPVEVQRKRLYMRSIRRGIKEMDLILQAFADQHLDGMEQDELTLYEALLQESDHDLYQWVSSQVPTPEPYLDLMGKIQTGAVGVTRPD